MMHCRDLGNRSPLAHLWHRLWCAKCRAAHKADGILDRGILALKSAPPPSDLLGLTIATVGIAPPARRSRSKRWVAALSRLLVPTEMAALLLAGGWFHYMDLDPQIPISVPPLPSPNAYDIYAQAAKIRDPGGPGLFDVGSNADATWSAMGTCLISMNGRFSLYHGDRHHLPRGAHLVTKQEKYQRDLQDSKLWLRQSAGKIALLREGLKYACVPQPTGEFGMPANTISYPLIAEGEVREADGDLVGAVNSYCDALQIGVATNTVEMEEIATTRLWKLVDRLNAQQAQSALHRMESILKLRMPLADILRRREQAALANLMQHFRDPYWRIWARYTWRKSFYKADAPQGWSPEDMVAYIQTLPYSKRRLTHCYREQMERAIADAERPYCHRKILITYGNYSRNFYDTMPLPADLGELWVTIPLGNTDFYFTSVHSQTQEALLTVALALHIYRQEHGFYPATQTDLMPATLATLPVDPFTGQSLHYHLSGAGYMLYSVGPDGKDDNGAPIDQQFPAKVPLNALDQATFDTHGRYITTPQSSGDIVAGLNIRSGQINR